MQTLVKICFWVLVVGLLLNGLGSLGAAHEELRLMGFSQQANEVATLLSQYRSASAVKVGFALFAIFLRKEIFSSRKHSMAFLSVLLLMPLARTVSLFADGWPHYSLLLVTVLEYGLFALFLVHARRYVWGGAAADEPAKAKAGKQQALGGKRVGLEDPELRALLGEEDDAKSDSLELGKAKR